jgi:hypothetical protein
LLSGGKPPYSFAGIFSSQYKGCSQQKMLDGMRIIQQKALKQSTPAEII